MERTDVRICRTENEYVCVCGGAVGFRKNTERWSQPMHPRKSDVLSSPSASVMGAAAR